MAQHTMTMEDYNQVARFGLCALAMSCQPGQLFYSTAEALQEVVFSLDKHVFLWLVPCPIQRRTCQGSCVCALIGPQWGCGNAGRLSIFYPRASNEVEIEFLAGFSLLLAWLSSNGSLPAASAGSPFKDSNTANARTHVCKETHTHTLFFLAPRHTGVCRQMTLYE